MAMPSSGCIALRTCITGCACSSIACAVNGSVAGNCCLSLLSTIAGKTAPHSMTEFYSYAPAPTTFDVSVGVNYVGLGTGMEGTAYLRCSDTTVYGSCYINGYSANFSWTSVPAGSYYVDMGSVFAQESGFPIPTRYEWTDSFSNGTTPYTANFSANNVVSFDVYDDI